MKEKSSGEAFIIENLCYITQIYINVSVAYYSKFLKNRNTLHHLEFAILLYKGSLLNLNILVQCG